MQNWIFDPQGEQKSIILVTSVQAPEGGMKYETFLIHENISSLFFKTSYVLNFVTCGLKFNYRLASRYCFSMQLKCPHSWSLQSP